MALALASWRGGNQRTQLGAVIDCKADRVREGGHLVRVRDRVRVRVRVKARVKVRVRVRVTVRVRVAKEFGEVTSWLGLG